MGQRQDLQTLLEGFGAPVYFQPPTNLTMEYPCIVYERDGSSVQHADDRPYRRTKRYQVTVIDRNPDSDLPDKVEELPTSRFDRWFATSNLNHFVFNLFF